jgi:hypothetical protein
MLAGSDSLRLVEAGLFGDEGEPSVIEHMASAAEDGDVVGFVVRRVPVDVVAFASW